MPRTQDLALNFFALRNQALTFRVYRKPSSRSPTPEALPSDVYLYRLPGAIADESQNYVDYDVCFEAKQRFEPFDCEATTNVHLTCRWLFNRLIEKCTSSLSSEEYRVDSSFSRRIFFVLERFAGEGERTVWLSPYFLKPKQQFGFLADFKFERSPEAAFNRRILQLSLSLDKAYRDNSAFYVDRHKQLLTFIRKFASRLFPLPTDEGLELFLATDLTKLPTDSLDTKTYLFQGGRSSKSQFMGVRDHGPLEPAPEGARLYFVYCPGDKALSHDLYRALRGDTYRTFPGMQRMFQYGLGPEHVTGVPIQDYSNDSVRAAVSDIKQSSQGSTAVPIVIVPWSRHDPPDERADYYRIKYHFLSESLPSQFVSLRTLQDRQTLKWSVSNIGLGVFAKMRGRPWKVRPQTDRCLIVGIGQSHRRGDNGSIHRFYAYSVLTDSSGIYERLQPLSQSEDESRYLHGLSSALREVFAEYSDRFDKFAVHTPFSLRRDEMAAIEQSVNRYSKEHTEKEMVVLKFNEHSKFFGYDSSTNSMVPYESTFVRISGGEFLIWFEGLQYHNPNVRGKIGHPLHVEFAYPEIKRISTEAQRGYLQDAVNLSGANWRGFNAKTLPVSVYYSKLIATFIREFDRMGFPEVELEKLSPWFL